MKLWLAVLLIVSGLSPVFAEKPNVIVILTDDQGSVDLGSWGTSDIETPHLDQLAADGVRFTQFYAAAPVCSPSRAGLLTGRYPERVGVPANATSKLSMYKGLPLREVTMAEMFRDSGYRTALIGKWHLGYHDYLWPNRQGFDHYFGHHGGCIDNYSHFFYWNGSNRHDLYRNGVEIYEDGKFFPDMMVDEAVAFIDGEAERGRNKDDPFFMYFAMNMPHYPYQGDDKWLQHYREKGVAYPRDLYNAFVSTLDDRIGRLIAALEERGMRENTIIIFQSDHGHSTEERAHFGGGNAGVYRGAKRSLFEGGIRVPAIISWPAGIEKGGVRDQMLSALDWMPTVAELAGVSTDVSFDGKSMVPLLNDDTAAPIRTRMHWDFLQQWAVRDGDWKLLFNVMDTTKGNPGTTLDGYFLANLAEDPAESRNLTAEHPDVLQRMIRLHEEMLVPESERNQDFKYDYPVLAEGE